MHIATLETRNFSFEAYGATDDMARRALIGGLERHAKTHKIGKTWWFEFRDDVTVRQVEIGACYRDRESI